MLILPFIRGKAPTVYLAVILANFVPMSVVKEMFSRKRVLPLLLLLVLVLVWYVRRPTPMMKIEGVTFGTIAYHIQYKDDQERNFKASIDSLLVVFNNALSHYIPDSELSRFNQAGRFVRYESPFLLPVLEESQRIFTLSRGAYNPAVMPLVNAWGFGPGEEIRPDSAFIDSLRAFTDFSLVHFDNRQVWKDDPRVQLDFSASAKGYGVDVIAHFLLSKGIGDYFVEIGGEVACAGLNAHNKPWRIGIIDPASDLLNQAFIATVDITDIAVATSANNFNYRVINDVRYSHTLDPATGYPVTRSILSASIFAPECMTADALATACMVMGVDKAKAMLAQMPEVEALLIYSTKEGGTATYITDGLKPLVTFVKQN